MTPGQVKDGTIAVFNIGKAVAPLLSDMFSAMAPPVVAGSVAALLALRRHYKPHRIIGRIWGAINVVGCAGAIYEHDDIAVRAVSAATLASITSGVYFVRTKKFTKHKISMGVAVTGATALAMLVTAAENNKSQLVHPAASNIA